MPGRVRLKAAELRGNSLLADAIAERLHSVAGIRAVEINTITGSVLVRYDVKALDAEALRALSEVLMPLFPALDTSAFQLRLTTFEREIQHGNGDTAAHVDRTIASFLGTINAGVGRATGGVDLRLLIPLALLCLGIRGLLAAERVAFPSWYDLLWFSFGTFVALNTAPRTTGG